MSHVICDDAAEVEKQYSPSMWSQRFSGDEVLKNHVEVVKAASERALEEVKHMLDVEYGPSPQHKFDIFGMDLPDDSPLLVFIHGGYWQELSRELSRYPAPALWRTGIRTVILGYELAPQASLPDIVRQTCAAIKLIFQFAECTKSRGVYLAGHSAGAHLVAKALADTELMHRAPGCQRLQGAFLISGVFDLTYLVRTSMNNALRLDDATAATMSPMFDDFSHLRDRRIRTYVVAGEHDSPTFKKQSREFYHKLLSTCSVQNMYLEIKDGLDHFEIVETLARDDNYLKNLLFHDIAKCLRNKD